MSETHHSDLAGLSDDDHGLVDNSESSGVENSASLVEPVIIAGDKSDIVIDMTDISGPIELGPSGINFARTDGPRVAKPVSDTQWIILQEILNERERQDEEWGPVPRLGHTFGKWLKILIEEIGEACACELEVDALGAENAPISLPQVDIELTQAAAVLVAWLEHRAAIREQQRSIMDRYSPGFDEAYKRPGDEVSVGP